jgi:hypothetical protein
MFNARHNNKELHLHIVHQVEVVVIAMLLLPAPILPTMETVEEETPVLILVRQEPVPPVLPPKTDLTLLDHQAIAAHTLDLLPEVATVRILVPLRAIRILDPIIPEIRVHA